MHKQTEQQLPSGSVRVLKAEELREVSGGFGPFEGFQIGSTIGTVAGAAFAGGVNGAARWGIVGGALGFSAGLGWGIGSVIYDIGFNHR